MVASFPVASTGADGSSSSDTEYTLQCRHQLSVLLEAHRKFPDAAVHMQQVVAGRQRLLGELHSDTIDSKYHLGSQYRALKKLDKAEQLFAEVLKSRRAAFGEMDLQTLTAMVSLPERGRFLDDQLIICFIGCSEQSCDTAHSVQEIRKSRTVVA